jgi:DNA-binding NarL/FixJ family response regulator
MKRVLVVDDHAAIRRGIQSILGAWPEWQVSGEAANGEEAVQLTKDLKPDIVLMDISMPGMGGLEATRAIRKICPDAKVLLTLHDSLEWVETALRDGSPCRCSWILAEIGYGRRTDARLESGGGERNLRQPKAGSGARKQD